MICKNNIKISLTLYNKNGFEIEVGTVQTTCSGLNCNGCCVMTDVCTVCVANGSANNGTCTRRVIGPIINFFDPENLKK